MANTIDLKSIAERLKGSSPFTPKNFYVNIAVKSTHPKFKHAAIIFHNGEMIAWANNKGNHHAEVRAIEVATLYGFKKDLVLVSVRVTKNGRLALAKPCLGCLFHAKMKGIKTILYSTNKQTIIKWGEK